LNRSRVQKQLISVTEQNINSLKSVIEKTHGVEARFIESVPVTETFEGRKVWEGIVNIFEITGHKTAKICYAWSYPIEGSKKHRFSVVLQSPPINTPQEAVRVAIIQEYHSK
jgi:hypothetical protein